MSAAPPEIIQELESLADVSRETLGLFETYLELLEKWQARINLVSGSTLNDAWSRHIVDSAQLWPLIPAEAKVLTDLGSGAGFPGLVLAILGRDRPEFEVHLVESDQRKATFLREVIRVTGVKAQVHCARAEEMEPIVSDIVTARALAPLEKLLSLTNPFVGNEGIALLLKGRSAAEELAVAAQWGTFEVEVTPSRTDRESSILKLSSLIPAS